MDFTLGKVFSVTTVKTTGEMRGINWWFRASIDGRSLRWLMEQSCQPILATNVQQGRYCGTSTGQESPEMSLPSTRHARTRVYRVPLQPLPVMEEPFRRVAVDIVGPLQRTKQGNKYVLTFMDFATRYPEAIPLRKIDAATLPNLHKARATTGNPSNQGSNFMSHLMKRVTEILGINRIRTSPYHPQTNGMLEWFHATLKSMIQKSSREKNQWDLYLPYACFAYTFCNTIHPI